MDTTSTDSAGILESVCIWTDKKKKKFTHRCATYPRMACPVMEPYQLHILRHVVLIISFSPLLYIGVNEPEFQFVFDFANHVSYLIAPFIPEAERMWKGEPDSVEEMLQKYDVDQIIYEHDLARLIEAINPPSVFVLDTTDTTPISEVVPRDKIDACMLKPAMYESRLLKFPWEIQLIRKVTHLSSHAHITLMREVQFGKNESELQALFEWECARNGAGYQSYLPIVASGKHAATLHYTHNNKWLNRKDNPDMLLLVDAGGEKNCYGTDITRTYPVSGKFSPEAKTIYNIVLKMQQVF